MMLGKIGQAAKYINNDDSVKGVHPLTDEIKNILQSKHPAGREADQEVILEYTSETPQRVIYENITEDKVLKIARNMSGSGGPTLIDTDTWKDLLCSKVFGTNAIELRQAVADLAKKLCIEEIHPDSLVEYTANRLIPLDKGPTKDNKPGVRPIGIGEVLRRIVAKLLIGLIKEDIIQAAGPIQTCAGLKGGIEAAIHAMRKTWEKPETEAMLLVDAENAFNNVNRKVALQNIKQICPPFYRYLHNTYQQPALLVIPGENTHETIYSEEGCTQGDVNAMALYGLGISPLVSKLSEVIDPQTCVQSWYADDSSSAGKLIAMRRWWDTLCIEGPKYGYYPLATKTVLIVKEEHALHAREIFQGTGVTITTEGERHMGAVIGSEHFKRKYIEDKVTKWVQDVITLANIAQDEPQAAYSSFTKAISHRWTYVQRTVPNISELFEPLESAIRDKFIPALVGRTISDTQRKIFALPIRLGGMGIRNPTETSDNEFEASTRITENLTDIICRQEKNLDNYDKDRVVATIKEVKKEKDQHHQNILAEISNGADDKLKRTLALLQEKVLVLG